MSGADLRLVGRWAVTLAIGSAGGWLATRIGAPLPWLLGALAATGAAAAWGVRFLGGPPTLPPQLRLAMIPVIGVLIGGAFSPETLDQMGGWWVGLVSVALFTPTAHAVNYLILRRLRFDAPTAFFAAMPGGLIEAIEMGSERGANVAALSILQFARIAIVVTAIPLIYSIAQGEAVGSAAGVVIGGKAPLTPFDAALLIAAGALGLWGGRRLKLPAGQITGPLLLSALVHGAGWTAAAPPPWLVALAQLVIGTFLGCRFAGVAPALLRRCFGASLLIVTAMLALGAVFAALVSLAGVAPFAVMALCYAPGGLVEMGLIAVSLNASPILVTAHHIVRILCTVSFAVAGWRRLGFDRRDASAGE